MAEQHLCIIPARSGSKTIVNKNLIQLNHKTLVRMALEVALKANFFSRVIVSTDYPRHRLQIDDIDDIATLSKVVYAPRHAEFARDDTRMMDTIQNVLDNYGGSEKWIWVLQPTSPFRTVDDFKRIKTALSSGEWEACISFKPLKEYIDRSYTVKEGVVYRINQSNYKNKEELRPQVTRSGNFYVTTRENIAKRKTFEVKPFFPYVMGNIDVETAVSSEILRSRKLGVNIDDTEDLEAAKGVIRRGDFVL